MTDRFKLNRRTLLVGAANHFGGCAIAEVVLG